MSSRMPTAAWRAERIEALLDGEPVRRDERSGLDHGAWVPVLHLFPDADVPMLQVSLPTLDGARLFELGWKLAPLTGEGVLLIGSGNLTHHLRLFDWSEGAPRARAALLAVAGGAGGAHRALRRESASHRRFPLEALLGNWMRSAMPSGDLRIVLNEQRPFCAGPPPPPRSFPGRPS